MIDKSALISVIKEELGEGDTFLVDVSVSGDNDIVVAIDSLHDISIEECESLTRAIEAKFDRDVEDYQLEVGSAGLTTPFKVKRQYDKNIGNELEVLTGDGRKLKGVLKSAGDDSFVIGVTKKVKPEGAKRPVMVEEEISLTYNETKYTKYLIQF